MDRDISDKFTLFSCRFLRLVNYLYIKIINLYYNYILIFSDKSKENINIYQYDWSKFNKYSLNFGSINKKLKDIKSTKSTTEVVSEMSVFMVIISVLLSFSFWFTGLQIGTLFRDEAPMFGLPVSDAFRETLLSVLPLIVSLSFAIIGFVISFFLVYYTYYIYLVYTGNELERKINKKFGLAVKTMYGYSKVENNLFEIIDSISDKEDKYGELSNEMEDIIKYTENENLTLIRAIERKKESTVSDRLSSLLNNFINDLEKGVSAEDTLQRELKEIRNNEERELEEKKEIYDLITEMFINLFVFPVFLMVVLLGFNLLNPVDPQIVYILSFIPLFIMFIFVGVIFIIESGSKIGKNKLEIKEEELSKLKKVRSNKILGFEDNPLDKKYIEKSILDKIERVKKIQKIKDKLKSPFILFRSNPSYTLFVSIPLLLLLWFIIPDVPTLSFEGFEGNTYLMWFYNIGLIVLILGFPIAFFNYLKKRRKDKIFKNLNDFLNRIKVSMEQGEDIDNSIDSQNINNKYLENLVEETKNKRKWTRNTIVPLKELTNSIKIPSYTHVSDMIITAQKKSGNISEIIDIAENEITKIQERRKEEKNAGNMSFVLIFIIILIINGIMAMLVRSIFLTTMADAIPEGAELQGVGGGGEVDLMLESFRASIIIFELNAGLTAGFVAGMFRTKELQASIKYAILGMLIFGMISIIITLT